MGGGERGGLALRTRALLPPRVAQLALAACVALAVPALARPAAAQDVTCEKGDREVRSLAFRGNRAFSSGDLALRVGTTPSSWARRHLHVIGSRRCLDSGELPRDVARLLKLYRDAGYVNAVVDTIVAPAGPNQVAVTFTIAEGSPVRIDSVAITGLDSVPERREITAHLWLARGRPFDKSRIAADADTIVQRLRNSGYPRADLLNSYEVRRDSLLARVAFQVLPGPRARVGNVRVEVTPVEGRGQQIPTRIVNRLLGIGPGELYRDQDLVRAQRTLYQTGAYRHVEVSPALDSVRLYRDSLADVRVLLREDFTRQLDTEFGWATLDCFRTRAQLTDKNFLNGARRLELTGQLSKIAIGKPLATASTRNLCWLPDLRQDQFSDTLNYSVAATLRQPAFFGTFATPALSVYSEHRSEYKAYSRRTWIGGEASLTKDLLSGTSARLGYNLEYGSTQAEPALLCAVFSRCDPASQNDLLRSRSLAVASLAGSRVRTDNPVSPSAGYVVRGELRSSSPLIGSASELAFNKGVADFAWYHGLGWGNVLAVRLRGGIILGGESATGTTDTRLPPPQERLYAGGATSVRGFQQNELGSLLYIVDFADTVKTSDTTGYFVEAPGRTHILRVVPVGGNSLAVANVDYRVRDPFFPELIQYTLFADAGAVWTRARRLPNLGFRNVPVRWTPGVGVRVFSPVGPIQANVGYNPYQRPAGAAFYAPNIQEGKALYCVNPAGSDPGTQVVLRNEQWQPLPNLACPATYNPPSRTSFFQRLTFTFSIGPEF